MSANKITIKNSLTRRFLLSAIVFAVCAANAAAQKQTDLTIKDASIVKQPRTLLSSEIKVTVANNDKNKAEKISVTVYAMPAAVCRLQDVTNTTNFTEGVKQGKITESDFNLFNSCSKIANSSFYNFKDKASVEKLIDGHDKPSWLAWAQSSQEINLEPNAAQTLNFKMPLAYAPPVTGDAEKDKYARIILYLYSYHPPYNSYDYNWNVASAKKLTFNQSVFYVEVKGGVDKNEKDNTYFIAPQLL